MVASLSSRLRGTVVDANRQFHAELSQATGLGKGVGLGLAVCQAIIEQHKGTIAIASPGPGRGATVIVELPVEP